MTLRELGPTAAELQSLRAELDELIRARQFAAQRERRLAEAARSGRASGEGRADNDLLRQLAQAQNLREGLGAKCLELSDRLIAMEDHLLTQQRYSGSGRSASETDHRPPVAPTAPTAPAVQSPPFAENAGRPHRGHPTEEFTTTPAAPTTPSRPTARSAPTAAKARAKATATPGATAPATTASTTTTLTPAAPSAGTNNARDAFPPISSSAGPTSPAADHQRPQPVRARTAVELGALAQRIAELHRRGAVQDSASIVAQAAVTLIPADVARLVGLLRDRGPAGSAGYLARATAYGTAAQTAGTLAELRTIGLVEEAAELFHTLWSVPVAALPEMLEALDRAGQSADGHTLLWEWASAPPAELAELAARLRDAGRPDDVRSLLRQAVGRPTGEVATVALELEPALATGLIGEVVRLRSAADLGEFAAAVQGEPTRYEALLTAVTELEESRARSAFAALRSAGLPTELPRSRSRNRNRR